MGNLNTFESPTVQLEIVLFSPFINKTSVPSLERERERERERICIEMF